MVAIVIVLATSVIALATSVSVLAAVVLAAVRHHSSRRCSRPCGLIIVVRDAIVIAAVVPIMIVLILIIRIRIVFIDS